jgi:hypothetical protein
MNEGTAAGAYVTGGNDMPLPPRATETRYTFTRTLAGGATIARALPYLIWNVTAGVAVDITLRIAAPQMQFGATATDPNITYGTQTTSRYWRIAKTTTGSSASVSQGGLTRGRLKARVSLLAGNSSQASVGVYDTVTPGWGNLAALSTGVILAGPGAVSKGDVGALYHVTGLSSTVPTVFEIDRVDNGNALYVYPDLSGSVVLGASVQVGECKVVAGLQGTLPTGWFQTGSATGLTRTIQAATVDGRSGIAVRYRGTAVTGSLNLVMAANTMPIVPGTAYARSVSWRLAAGSAAPLTYRALVSDVFNASSAYIGGMGTSIAAPTATLARPSNAGAAPALAAFANAYFNFTVAAGAVDFTLEIGLPQFEQAAAATFFADPRYAYISGTPTAPGFYVLAVTATNSLDTDDAALALTINQSPAVSAAQSGGWGKFIRQ